MKNYIFGNILDEKIDKNIINNILNEAENLKKEIKKISIKKIIEILDTLANKWSDSEFFYRKEALKMVPNYIGFSKEMVEAGIEVMIDLLRKESIFTRLNTDLGNYRYLDNWVLDENFKGYIKAQPLGIVAHISAGNVFVGGVDSLIQGIITKNVNIMKMSSNDPIFPILFAESLKTVDETGILYKSLAIIPWKGGDEEIESVLKTRCNGIVVYGGAETIKSYRDGLGLHTKLIEYGPKYSFVIVDSNELMKRGIKNVSRLIAKDVTMWEQSACSSPHVVYINSYDVAEQLLYQLSEDLEYWSHIYPKGRIDDDSATEITKLRELAKVEKAMEISDYRFSSDLKWTVILNKNPSFQTSCLHRTIIIKPVKNIDEILVYIKDMGNFFQTVALVTSDEDAKKISMKLADIGADRFVEPGKMSVRKHGTPHDGSRGLGELVKWISLSRDTIEASTFKINWKKYDKEEDYFDFLPDDKRDKVTFSRLQYIVNYCREKSPLLAERYKGLELKNFEDFLKFPLMTGDDYKKFLPPYGNGLLTSSVKSGYIFSSGGTTGSPKLVYRTHEEQHYNALKLGKGLALSTLEKGDVVANLLFAGNLWASFVSFNQALEHTGCQILPIAGNIGIEIVNYLRLFKANAVITIPSVLISIANYVEKNQINDLKIEKAITGGEHLFEGAKEYLKEILEIKEFYSTGYTTNDTGAIGYQCKKCCGGIHHVHEDLHYVEILDISTGLPVKPGEIGKIVVTNLQRTLMPTIRYDVGDLGRWIEGKCVCGRNTRLFELLGRADEILIIGGVNIQPETIASAVHEVEELSEYFQMIADLDGFRDILIIKAEKKENFSENDSIIAKKLEEKVYKHCKEIKTVVEKGLAAPLKVEILPPGTIERNPKTGKIKISIDKRLKF